MKAPLLGHGSQREEPPEGWGNPHSAVSKGATRAAVLGALDGLVSNLCLILGVMAPCLNGEETDKTVLLTGTAGILAGAFSMAVGEWLSITAENEHHLAEIETERLHIVEHRQEENAELMDYFVEQGLRAETARQVISDLEGHPEATSRLLNFHAKFHWGIDEEDLSGSASVAAIVSFVAFASGGLIPLLPWTCPCSVVESWHTSGGAISTDLCLKVKLALTVALSTVAMFTVGFILALPTPTNAFYGGFRHTLCGMGAAAATFGIGYAIGAAIG
eukprot:CAMPEP_0197485994 /NCGR_PEP_ID=MMETSP1311-20131121/909_1 /TAXON_ID=464262 /ORGANISM="Genus nov. species nov., Strain RCC856" /LENGTH=274 /DNA_ID=CAMNT_0043028837 /DNA_START=33 /DNA_END=857 /DNA_ORIENTATION=-